MDGLREQLSGHERIGLDTSIFIYHFEAHPKYQPLAETILTGVAAGNWQAVTSAFTLMELTVQPWRENRPNVARGYEALLANFPNLLIADVNRDVARTAARLRAQYNLRPADALQIGTAITHGATAWVGNDRMHLTVSEEVDVILLVDGTK